MNKRSKVYLLLTAASAVLLAASFLFSLDTLKGIQRQRQEAAVIEELQRVCPGKRNGFF